MISLLDDTYVAILDKLKDALLPILIVVLILTLIKVWIDYKKYGKKIFSPFKKHKDINIFEKTLEMSIKNLNSYYKIIKLNDSNFILLIESGIYVINLCNYEGMITGNVNAAKLVLKANTASQEKLDNPVFLVQEIIKKLNQKIENKIDGYVLLKKGCLFSVLNRTDIKIIPANAFYYHFSKLISDKIYDEKQIDSLYEKIV